MANDSERNLEGIGGWLILILIGIIVSSGRLSLHLYQSYVPIFSDGTWEALTSTSSERYHSLWAPLIWFEIVGNLAIVLLGLGTLYLFFTRSRHTPRMAITWLATGLFFVVTDFFLADQIPFIAAQPTDMDSVKEVARSVVGAAIWIPYFLVSKRVKATFTR